jgi:hypothetical protein
MIAKEVVGVPILKYLIITKKKNTIKRRERGKLVKVTGR